jgi:glucose-1-phosphate thymidylyltransferase
MKGLVLAGGLGTGLRPITDSMPKQLIPIANQPILVHVLDRIRAMDVTEVGIIVGDKASQIAAELGDGSQFGLSISYIHQPEPLGLAHGVALARDFLADDDFVMYLGDCLLGAPIVEMAEQFRRNRPAAQVVVTKVADPSGFGVVKVGPDGAVVRLEEKPADPRDDLVLTGVYFFTAAIHPAVAAIEPGPRGEWEITDAVQWLLHNDRTVVAGHFDGLYSDVGAIPDVLECNRKVLDELRSSLSGQVDGNSELIGPVVVERGARIVRSRVEGPVIIGADTVVADSTVGPHTSIGKSCVLRSARLSYSIVMDNATVCDLNAEVSGSIIGRAASVSGTDQHNRLLISDHCRVHAV